jgi:flagellar hook protein FlgE
MLMGPDVEDSPGEPTTYITVTGNVDKMDSSIYTKEGHGVSAGALIPGEEGFESYNINFSITDAGDDDDTTYLMTLTGVTDSTGKSVDFEEQEIELTYSPADGKLTSAETANINVGGVGITIDISKTTNYNTSGTTTLRTSRGDAEGNGEGQEDGKMSGITIQRDGQIFAKYTNGDTRLLAQMATATFMNATGLVNEGDNLYSASNASGDPDIAPVTESGGSISTGVLEASNVDLSDEFTRMITAQRAFQANSRVITTSDTMLSELRNLKST